MKTIHFTLTALLLKIGIRFSAPPGTFLQPERGSVKIFNYALDKILSECVSE